MFLDLKNLKEIETFLSDFFTDEELETYTKRLAIAYWLKKGRTHQNIVDNLKVSSAVIASVEKEVNKPGFKLALKRVGAEEWANTWAERIKRIVK